MAWPRIFAGFSKSKIGAPVSWLARKGVGGFKGIMEHAWQYQSLEGLSESLLKRATNSVTVSIQGQPQADLNQLYELAIATTIGVIPKFIAVADQAFSASIDHKNKRVEVQISYSCFGLIRGLVNGHDDMRKMVRSPIDTSVKAGPSWPDFLSFGRVAGALNATPAAPILNGAAPLVVTDYDPITPANNLNPTLPINNGTRGVNGTVAYAAPLKDEVCDLTKPPPNLVYTPSQMSIVRGLFGI